MDRIDSKGKDDVIVNQPIALDEFPDSATRLEQQGLSIDEIEAKGGYALQRNLKARHAAFLSLGAALGTGLLLGTGTTLARAGGVGMFLGFLFVGTLCYGTIVALGEMAAFYPTQTGFPGHGKRFVSPAFGAALGFIYWAKYAINSPTQFAACSVVINYWIPSSKVNNGVFIAICIVVIAIVQAPGVRWFGEFEFWASSFKIIVLCGLIIMGIVLDLGGGPNHDRIGFRYWLDEPFSHYLYQNKLGVFLGFWSGLVNTTYSYAGTETVGIALGEMKNPVKNVPRAVKGVLYRIVFFYIGSALILGMLVPGNSPLLLEANSKAANANASPWVVAINQAGISVLPHIVNACILVFVLSAAGSDVYINSRSLYGLARDGNAPKFLMRTNSRGTPYVALGVTFAFCLLAFTATVQSAYTVFKYFVSAVTLFATITWLGILFAHIRFMKACKVQGLNRADLPFTSNLNPYLSYYAFVGTLVVSIFKGFDAFTPKFNATSMVTNYVAFPTVVIAFICYRLYYKTGMLKADEIDLTTGIQAFRDEEEEETRYEGRFGWLRTMWSA